MKILYFLLFYFLFTNYTSAQTSKTLYGNFVFDQEVYQYEYKKDGTIHTLRLSTLAEPSQIMDLDSSKLSKSILALEALIKDSTIKSSSLKDSISKVTTILKELQSVATKNTIWKQHSVVIDSIENDINKLNIDSILASKKAQNVYKLSDLTSIYKNFLQLAIEPKQTKRVPFSDFKEDVFKRIFEDQMNQLLTSTEKSLSIDKKRELSQKANEIMFEIKARYEFEDDEPTTAYLNLKKKYITIDVPIKTTSIEKRFLGILVDRKINVATSMPINFKLTNLQIEFEEGTMKHILVDLLPMTTEYQDLYGTSSIRFRNVKPISISGKFDPENFAYHSIFVGNSREFMNTLYLKAKEFTKDKSLSEDFFKKNNNQLSFTLSNLLDYVIIPKNNNEDYSPADTVIELNENRTTVVLKKERRSRILTARAYTDFIGLNDDQPNGLVQVEVSRKINIVTDRNQFHNRLLGFIKSPYMYSGNFTFIEPRLSLSKLEENNRYLVLDSFSLDREKSLADSQNHFKINPLEAVRYQQWMLGLTANIFKVNFINRKTNVQGNAFGGYGRVSTADSLTIIQKSIQKVQSRNISKINTLSYGFSLAIEFKPDTRWGLSFGQDVKWQKIFNRRIEFDDSFDPIYHTTWLEGNLKTTGNSGIFFRFRKNWINQQPKYNFYQMQLGYELDLFRSK